ncbi:MAG: ABC transporter substrate-binding protein [Acidilobaceae archaeon]
MLRGNPHILASSSTLASIAPPSSNIFNNRLEGNPYKLCLYQPILTDIKPETAALGHIDAFKGKYGDKNLELARSHLRKTGYSEANKLSIDLWYTPTHYGDTEVYIATVTKEQLEATGLIAVTLKSAEWGTYVQYIREGRLGIYLLGWYPDYLDPDNYMYPFLHSEANKRSNSGCANPEMDKILEDAQVIIDEKTRTQLYTKAQNILAEDVSYIPIFQGKLYIVVREEVKGVVASPTMLFFYSTVYKEVAR